MRMRDVVGLSMAAVLGVALSVGAASQASAQGTPPVGNAPGDNKAPSGKTGGGEFEPWQSGTQPPSSGPTPQSPGGTTSPSGGPAPTPPAADPKK